MLPREYVFNRALDMALRDLKDIVVTEDQRQLIVGGSVVPWSCRAKLQLYSHFKLIALAVALGTALVFSYRHFLLYRTERQLVDRFVKEVRFFLLDRTRKRDRFYPSDHLRDDLFEKQSLQNRAWLCKSVWPKVVAVVNDESRIRTREIKYVSKCRVVTGLHVLILTLIVHIQSARSRSGRVGVGFVIVTNA
ncbi:E3 ubiquitin-protein ligase [Phytophthora nicotianae]|uniref:E3 ubiquitin-protein ligase n=1 Tax=Phytophthora nicotianae TaxID=4792 RepID=A0A0W8DA99_PHYNI|nr:E3 ubiquitin-protein ligase [Phytophthora nicotianae]